MLRARINATGEVVDVRPYQHEVFDFMVCRNEGTMGELYTRDELTIIGDNEPEYPGDNTFDYWTRLEHQYAGMAMQGILGSEEIMKRINTMPIKEDQFGLVVAELSVNIAHALMEKYKEKEE